MVQDFSRAYTADISVIASEAKQSHVLQRTEIADCFVTPFLAMTK
jgi:hypothetical protein